MRVECQQRFRRDVTRYDLLLLLLLPLVCMIPLEHFRTIDYVHVREGWLVYLLYILQMLKFSFV